MTKVRGNGTIYPLEDKPKSKCRKWKLQVSLGRNLATGKYDKAFKNVMGTHSEAKKALRDFIAEIESGSTNTTSHEGFAAYSASWLDKRKTTVEHGTWRKNCDHIRAARMHLEDAKLSEITPQVLETMYDALRGGESPSGKKLSGTYVNCISKTLHKMFHDAIKDGKMSSNPCDLATAPQNDTPERKRLSYESMLDLIEKLDPRDPPQLVILAGLKDGMRRGEVHGLRGRSFEGNIVSILWTVDNTGKPKKKAKTKKSARTHPVSDSLMEDFAKRIEYMKSVGLPTGPDDPIICNRLGEYMLPNSSTRWWGRHRKELGFDGWTIHEMRHSFASEMAKRVQPKVLQEWLGHESFNTTMDIYVHVGMEEMEDAREAIDW